MPDQIDLSVMQSVPSTNINGFTRLHRYWTEPTGEMWDGIWRGTDYQEYWRAANEGVLARDYGKVFDKFLQGGERLLEAGCGMGQVAVALNARGFECHGLDFARHAIDTLQRAFPNLPFKHGDIRSLPYPDLFFDGYVSLGVIEHFVEGQNLMLAEAARVLKPGGFVFVSVPALNSYRRLRCRCGGYDSSVSMPFFESCISVEEMKFIFREAGLEFLDAVYMNPVMTFVQETPLRPLYRMIEDRRRIRGVVDRALKFILPNAWFGHMVMVIGRKG